MKTIDMVNAFVSHGSKAEYYGSVIRVNCPNGDVFEIKRNRIYRIYFVDDQKNDFTECLLSSRLCCDSEIKRLALHMPGTMWDE